jgi:hypothetical protein
MKAPTVDSVSSLWTTVGGGSLVSQAGRVPPPRRHLTGVFIGSHAIAEGFLTRGELRTRSYRRLVQGVYADPALPLDHRLRCQAVGLLMPAGAAIGGHSAAAWYGAPFASAVEPVTVVCPEEIRWRGPRAVRLHHTELFPQDLVVVDDLPVTTALRTAWDVMALEPLGPAVAALDAMVREEAVSLAQLEALVHGGGGRWGVGRVRRAVPLVDPRAESPQESRLRVVLVLAGLQPVPQFEVFDGGRFLARVDLAWPEARLAVEYEGAPLHRRPDPAGRRPARAAAGGRLAGHPRDRR